MNFRSGKKKKKTRNSMTTPILKLAKSITIVNQ